MVARQKRMLGKREKGREKTEIGCVWGGCGVWVCVDGVGYGLQDQRGEWREIM